jgi:hypothetical protein
MGIQEVKCASLMRFIIIIIIFLFLLIEYIREKYNEGGS